MDVTTRTPPSINKWPFLLGDILLLGLAVFILMRNGGDLNSWQIGFCVFGVIVGALLLVAPFIIEFYLKQKLHEENEANALEAVHERMNHMVREVYAIVDAQREESKRVERTFSAYEGLASLMDDKLKSFQVNEEQGVQVLLTLTQELKSQLGSFQEALDSGLSARWEKWETDLEAREAKSLQRWDQLQEGYDDLKGISQSTLDRLSQLEEDLRVEVDGLKSSLDSLSTRGNQLTHLVEMETEAPANAVPEAEVESSVGQSEAIEADSQGESLPEAAEVVMESPDEIIGKATHQELSSPETRPTAEAEPDPEPTSEPEDLFDDEDLLPAERRMLEKAMGGVERKSEDPSPVDKIIQSSAEAPPEVPDEKPARIIANILIGIGNKLYIRGIGPGLSQDKGTPLSFVEIGKFDWVAPDGSAPITCQLYLNDEVPANNEPITINPGEEIEVSPDFPRG